jgi:hypothetical protein
MLGGVHDEASAIQKAISINGVCVVKGRVSMKGIKKCPADVIRVSLEIMTCASVRVIKGRRGIMGD